MGCSAATAVFVGTSILFSIVILCCLHRHCYQKRKMITIPPSITYRKPIHYYDEVALPKQEIGMRINEVYYSTVHKLGMAEFTISVSYIF